MNLVCFNIQIRIDKEGRYCLNDLHKAAGGEERHGPKFFMATQQAKELANELSDGGIPPSVSIKGGKNQGTYVCKELVYAYAMWISAKFHLHVIQTFDQFNQTEQLRKSTRIDARLDFRIMTDAIKHFHEEAGSEAKWYHYSNECDMINRMAFGMTARQFRNLKNIPDSEPIRDYLTYFEIRDILYLQNSNTSLIDMGKSFDERKKELQAMIEKFRHRESKKLGNIKKMAYNYLITNEDSK